MIVDQKSELSSDSKNNYEVIATVIVDRYLKK